MAKSDNTVHSFSATIYGIQRCAENNHGRHRILHGYTWILVHANTMLEIPYCLVVNSKIK